jgi:phage internal scaffolding protein
MSRENRKKLYCKDISKTDQSYKKSTDINVLIAKYQKTGIVPNLHQRTGSYGDFSEVPTLEDAFERVNSAIEAFNSLPADIRKLMDNDASQLASWLSNEDNHEMAIKYGLLEKKDITDNSSTGGVNESTTTENTTNHGDNNA